MRESTAARNGVLPPIPLDRNATASLGMQIARALREAIRNGQLEVGTRLPPSRDAAQQLGVGRNAVVEAYDELHSEGLVAPRGRLGSFVSVGTKTPQSKSSTSSSVREADVPPRSAYDWRLGRTSIQLLPLRVWRAACREAGRHLPPSGYGDPRGVHVLREAIAEWLRRERGLVYDARQIVITQGTGAAVEALARLLVKPGDICVVENPGYTRAALAMELAGATVFKSPVDTYGINLEMAFQQPPRLIHLTPSNQYPMGARLSIQRRQDLVKMIQRHGGYLIENEYDHEFIFEGQNHAPIAASLPENTILVSTFSKAISPSLRVGFIAGPLCIADAISQDVCQSRQQVSWPVQVSLQWLLRSGEMRRHLQRVRGHFSGLRQQLLHAVAKDCPELHVLGHEGGPHVVLTTGNPQSDDLLTKAVLQRGGIVQTLRDFGGESNTLLLGYGHMDSTDLFDACALLASALIDLRQVQSVQAGEQVQPSVFANYRQ